MFVPSAAELSQRSLPHTHSRTNLQITEIVYKSLKFVVKLCNLNEITHVNHL